MNTVAFKSRLFWKLYAGYVALIVCGAASVALLLEKTIVEDTLAENRQALKEAAKELKEVAAPRLAAARRETFELREAPPGIRMTVIDASGRVLARRNMARAAAAASTKRPWRTKRHSSRSAKAREKSNTGWRLRVAAKSRATGCSARTAAPPAATHREKDRCRRAAKNIAGTKLESSRLTAWSIPRRSEGARRAGTHRSRENRAMGPAP